MTAGALSGLTVIDMTSFISGPYCTMLLADMGADVIKIERPGNGDNQRSVPPIVGGMSTTFSMINRNKRSIALDLKDPDDLDILQALILRADILVENMRVGTVDALKIDWTRIESENPKLIRGSISGFGQTGPWADHGGYDLMAQAMSGLMMMNGPPEGEPYKLPIAISDLTAGMYLSIAILGALHFREKTGVGQRVDTSLFQAAMSLATNEAAWVLERDEPPPRLGQGSRGSVPYGVYETADGYISFGASEDHFFKRFCDVLGLQHLLADSRFDTRSKRFENQTELNAIIRARLMDHGQSHWLRGLQSMGIPAEAVMTHDQALAHPQSAALNIVVDVPGSVGAFNRVLATPFKMSATPPDVRFGAPEVDEHGEEVRRWLSESTAALSVQVTTS